MAILQIKTSEGTFHRQVYKGASVEVPAGDGKTLTVTANDIYKGYSFGLSGGDFEVTRSDGVNVRRVAYVGETITPPLQNFYSVKVLDISLDQSRTVNSKAIVRISDENENVLSMQVIGPGGTNSKSIQLPNGDQLEMTVLRTLAGYKFAFAGAEIRFRQMKGQTTVMEETQVLQAAQSGIMIGGRLITVDDLTKPAGATKQYSALFQIMDANDNVLAVTSVLPGEEKSVANTTISVGDVAAGYMMKEKAAIDVKIGGARGNLNVGETLNAGALKVKLVDLGEP